MTPRIIRLRARWVPPPSGRGGFLRVPARSFARAVILPAVILVGSLASTLACAEKTPGSAAEYEVKAAYLLNFARFVEWPGGAFESDVSEIRIGIMGPGPLDRQVELGMEERLVSGRPVRVMWLKGPEAVASCHIVFVPHSAVNPERILAATAGKPILTVGESDSFAVRGGVIQLYLDDQVVHFEINRAAAERNGLKISSRLLSLARLTKVTTSPASAVAP